MALTDAQKQAIQAQTQAYLTQQVKEGKLSQMDANKFLAIRNNVVTGITSSLGIPPSMANTLIKVMPALKLTDLTIKKIFSFFSNPIPAECAEIDREVYEGLKNVINVRGQSDSTRAANMAYACSMVKRYGRDICWQIDNALKCVALKQGDSWSANSSTYITYYYRNTDENLEAARRRVGDSRPPFTDSGEFRPTSIQMTAAGLVFNGFLSNPNFKECRDNYPLAALFCTAYVLTAENPTLCMEVTGSGEGFIKFVQQLSESEGALAQQEITPASLMASSASLLLLAAAKTMI